MRLDDVSPLVRHVHGLIDMYNMASRKEKKENHWEHHALGEDLTRGEARPRTNLRSR